MSHKIHLEHIIFYDIPNQYGILGHARYKVIQEIPQESRESVKDVFPDGLYEWFVEQPFTNIENQNGDYVDEAGSRHHLWKWDGNRERPSLTPSFLCDNGTIRIHLFIKEGKIELCPDSNVVVE